MKDVMVDLETLGNRAGCAILSIGAVAFDRETFELGERFYVIVNTDSCFAADLVVHASTVEWWEKQSDEAKAVLRQASGTEESIGLSEALNQFNAYLERQSSGVKVWGNGSDFDNAILYSAYAAVDIEPSWKFWNSRCFRTLKDLNSGVHAPKREGVYHNALHDAITQANHAVKIFAKLKSVTQCDNVDKQLT